jgi:hypothetical protein
MYRSINLCHRKFRCLLELALVQRCITISINFTLGHDSTRMVYLEPKYLGLFILRLQLPLSVGMTRGAEIVGDSVDRRAWLAKPKVINPSN